MPWPTVRFKQVAVVTSIVTVAVLAIVTLSDAVGTTPPSQVPGALQFPPAAVEVIFAAFALKAESARKTMETRARRKPMKRRGLELIVTGGRITRIAGLHYKREQLSGLRGWRKLILLFSIK